MLLLLPTKICLIVVAAAIVLDGADNSIGTWRRDIAASKTATDTTKSETIVTEPFDDGVRSTGTMVKTSGTVVTWSTKVRYDGKEYPFAITDQKGTVLSMYDRVSVKQLDPNTFEWTKMGPSLRTVSLVVISKDGRTMTLTDRRESSDGKVLNLRYVYRRQ